MRAWAFLLGGMIVWSAHFFLLYIVASIFLDTFLARVLTIVITLACLAADGALLARAARLLRGGRTDEVAGWMASFAGLLAALSLVAVLWQGLPALLA